jgi:23S rRNA (adenine2030-N6)-methyltransferase
LKEVERRFATGTILLWYPIKDMRQIEVFRSKIADLGLAKALAVELMIRAADDPARLNGAGLIVVNAPYTLRANLEALLPPLTRILAQGKGAAFRLEELGAGE